LESKFSLANIVFFHDFFLYISQRIEILKEFNQLLVEQKEFVQTKGIILLVTEFLY